MIRNRLAKLEKLAKAILSDCPGCRQIPARILMPGDPDPALSETDRCARCGREHEPRGVRIIVPGLRGTLAATD